MDGFDARRRRLERAAAADPAQQRRLARNEERGGRDPELQEHLRASLAGDLAALREWAAGLVPFGRSLLLEGLAGAVEEQLEELDALQSEWGPRDAVEATRALARCPCPSHQQAAQEAAQDAEAGAGALAEWPQASMVAEAAARLARLAALHDPLASPKSLIQGAGVILRTLLAAGASPQAVQSAIAVRLTLNGC